MLLNQFLALRKVFLLGVCCRFFIMMPNILQKKLEIEIFFVVRSFDNVDYIIHPPIHLYLAFYDEIISLRRFLSLPILCSQQQKKYNIINEDVITRNEANSCNAANDSIPL